MRRLAGTCFKNSYVGCFIGVLLLGGTVLANINPLVEESVERKVYLMGTQATLMTLTTNRDAGLRSLDRMLKILEATERDLSTWDDNSLLTDLNQCPIGQAWHAPRDLCDLFEELFKWHWATDGAFDPAVGPLIRVWGIRADGKWPTKESLAVARAHTGLQHFLFHSEACTLTRLLETSIDAGAFGKGEALDRVLDQEGQQAVGPWMIDLGGQIIVSGVPAQGSWPVLVAHPEKRTKSVFELSLTEGSIAVSGYSERDRLVEGKRISHILDPRTGRPVSRNSSVVVWHPSALVADVLATALHVMGVDQGLSWAESQGLAACFILPASGSSKLHNVTLYPTATFLARFQSVKALL